MPCAGRGWPRWSVESEVAGSAALFGRAALWNGHGGSEAWVVLQRTKLRVEARHHAQTVVILFDEISGEGLTNG